MSTATTNMAPTARSCGGGKTAPNIMSAFVKKEIDKVGFRKKPSRADLGWEALLAGPDGKTVLAYGANRVIFCQGQPADSIFFVRRGKVKLSVTSKQGKEAIIAILGAEEFFGEGCLAGQTERNSTAIAMTDCSLAEVKKPRMTRMLQERQDINELFVTHLLSRNIRYEEDLVDQLFNSSEKRLARILLVLARTGKHGRAEIQVPRISQDNLAQMVGTTRSRVSHFMKKFRDLCFVEYGGSGELTVHSGLLSVIGEGFDKRGVPSRQLASGSSRM